MVSTTIKRNAYYDSVTLMRITSEIVRLPGITEASVCMGTPLNKELLIDSGLSSDESQKATPNDLIIAFESDDPTMGETVMTQIEQMLNQKAESKSELDVQPRSIKTAVSERPDANLVVISVPGKHAYLEAKEALMAGLHVFMFSDNLSLAEEKDLKDYATKKGLLMMGPDCGSAIINRTAIGFANEVNPGPIGMVAASGTGLQEITVLIDRYGGGITQAIGVGGRDLSEEIGGTMMLDGLSALADDDATKVIILLSKKPSDRVADKVIEAAKQASKPTVVCFLGEAQPHRNTDNLYFETTLEGAALKALELAGYSYEQLRADMSVVERAVQGLNDKQKHVRALYSGGTLCSEAFTLFKQGEPKLSVYSNTSKTDGEKLTEPNSSQSHSFVDLGDDMFTAGKAHPMIDPSLRNARIIQEAKDDSTAVILLDFVIGYGANSDPVGAALDVIKKAKAISPNMAVIGYVCGTSKDIQGLEQQRNKLESVGVILADSNAQAAKMALAIAKGVEE